MPDVHVELHLDTLRVAFNTVTHVRLDPRKLLGHQAWVDNNGNNKFVIEYTMEGGSIRCEYDDIEKWKAVLDGLDAAFNPEVFGE